MTQCSLGCWAVYHTGTVWTLSPAAAATLIAGGVGLVVVPPCIDTLCTDWAVLLGPHLLSLCHRVTVSPIPSVSPAMIVTDPWSWPRVTPVCIVCSVYSGVLAGRAAWSDCGDTAPRPAQQLQPPPPPAHSGLVVVVGYRDLAATCQC